jgi:hypothetical protein
MPRNSSVAFPTWTGTLRGVDRHRASGTGPRDRTSDGARTLDRRGLGQRRSGMRGVRPSRLDGGPIVRPHSGQALSAACGSVDRHRARGQAPCAAARMGTTGVPALEDVGVWGRSLQRSHSVPSRPPVALASRIGQSHRPVVSDRFIGQLPITGDSIPPRSRIGPEPRHRA